jgi:hypothetical protein
MYLLRTKCSQKKTGDEIEKNEIGGKNRAHGERKGVYRVLVGRLEGKRTLGKPRRRWEDNIKMDI